MANLRLATLTILLLPFALACVPSIVESADDSSGTDGPGPASDVSEVDLGAAGEFVILAKSGISIVTTATITGDVGLSPADATSLTGFALMMHESEQFAISPQVHGNVYSADYAAPTPTDLTTAVADMQLAFEDAAGRSAETSDLGAGDIGGLTLAPGVYEWGSDLSISTDAVLHGGATDVWIFQISQDLVLNGEAQIVLSGGAQAKNVIWQVDGAVDVGSTARFVGMILAKGSVTLRSHVTLDGRLLAQASVDIQDGTVVGSAQ